jgi:hypothetical protein
MKRYKYQALVTLDRSQDSSTAAALSGSACRMVVRAEHPETHRHKIFSALVSSSDGSTLRPGDHVLLTMRVLGDDANDYLSPGDHFYLWRGHDVGRGVVSRRLFI